MIIDVVLQLEELEELVEVLLLNINIVIYCVLKNDVECLRKFFEDDEDLYKEIVVDLINFRGCDGKFFFDLILMFGRIEFVKELIFRGVEVNFVNIKGFFFLFVIIYRFIYNLCDWVLFVEGNIFMF